MPQRWAKAQASLWLAVLASLSVHGVEYAGLTALEPPVAVHAVAPLRSMELALEVIPTPELDEPKASAEPPAQAEVIAKAAPLRRKVGAANGEQARPRPVHVDDVSVPEVASSAVQAPVLLALATAPEHAASSSCQTGACSVASQVEASHAGATVAGDGTALGMGSATARAAASNTEAVPLSRVQPTYPEIAAERELEGWVLVRFSITTDGKVVRPVVVKSQPSRIFDKAAIDAVLQWKYQPMLRDGRAIERSGMTVKIRFELE